MFMSRKERKTAAKTAAKGSDTQQTTSTLPDGSNLCGAFNKGGSGRNCQKTPHQKHLCNYRLSNGQACAQKHRRCDHHKNTN